MGLFPDLLPAMVPVNVPGAFADMRACRQRQQGLLQIFEAAAKGELGALLVVGANPVQTSGGNPQL